MKYYHYLGVVLLLAVFVGGYVWTTSETSGPVVEPTPTQGPTQQQKDYQFGVAHDSITGTTHQITLRPHSEEVQFYDNAQSTTLWTYGNSQEPVVIYAQEGDMLEIILENALPQETSIHRHGVRVPNDQDGVPGVTQKPVKPGATYTYMVPVQDAGTYFFHPHVNTVEQMGRGVYGILVVQPKEPAYEYDQELVLALKDYRLNNDGTLNENFEGMMDFTHGGRLGNVVTVNNHVAPSFQVASGTTLLRLVNPSNARIFHFDLSDWDARVVGTDGGTIANPYKPGLLEVGPGERFNILVDIDRSVRLVDQYFREPRHVATIRGPGTSKQQPFVIDSQALPSLPDRSDLVKSPPDEIITLGGVGVMGGDRRMGSMGAARGWTINEGLRPDSHEVLHWNQGEMRTVRLKNKSKRDHPMHLHGDFFQVLGINGNPVPRHGWKDTINVPANGYIDIALIPTNPGTWMFHCHIIEHAHFGMMTTVVVE